MDYDVKVVQRAVDNAILEGGYGFGVSSGRRAGELVREVVRSVPFRSSFDSVVVRRRLVAMVGDDRVDGRIFDKVVSALERRLLSESQVFNIGDGLRRAVNRGGYFVASIKNEFKKVGVSWIMEEWPPCNAR